MCSLCKTGVKHKAQDLTIWKKKIIGVFYLYFHRFCSFGKDPPHSHAYCTNVNNNLINNLMTESCWVFYSLLFNLCFGVFFE